MWEIFTGGDTPYGRMHNPDVVDRVVKGHRLEQPHVCPDHVFEIMMSTWNRVC